MAKFAIGNQAAEKWTEEEAGNVFYNMLNNASESEDILSLQDAIFSVGLYPSSMNYLVDKFPVFESIKKDIQEVVAARLNRGGLKGDFVPAIVIWRSKQLGERDTQYQDHTTKGESLNVSPKKWAE